MLLVAASLITTELVCFFLEYSSRVVSSRAEEASDSDWMASLTATLDDFSASITLDSVISFSDS
jgi:hypothetical protein